MDELPGLIKKSLSSAIGEVVFGILSSGTLKQSEIARALKERGRLHHTQKRLSRMLAGHGEVRWAAEQLLLQKVASRVHAEMILAIDPGDLNRDGAPQSEKRCQLRDGDKGESVRGYPLLSVVARDVIVACCGNTGSKKGRKYWSGRPSRLPGSCR